MISDPKSRLESQRRYRFSEQHAQNLERDGDSAQPHRALGTRI